MEATNEKAGSNVPPTSKAGPRRHQIRIGAVVAVALAIGFVLWLVLRNEIVPVGDSDHHQPPPPPARPRSRSP